MDPLYQYHQSHADQVRIHDPKLVQQLAAHALRKIPGSQHVLKKIVTGTVQPVSQIHPAPYNNDGKMQMMLH